MQIYLSIISWCRSKIQDQVNRATFFHLDLHAKEYGHGHIPHLQLCKFSSDRAGRHPPLKQISLEADLKISCQKRAQTLRRLCPQSDLPLKTIPDECRVDIVYHGDIIKDGKFDCLLNRTCIRWKAAALQQEGPDLLLLFDHLAGD